MKLNLRAATSWAAGILAAGLLLTDCLGGETEHVQGRLAARRYQPPYTTVECHTTMMGKTPTTMMGKTPTTTCSNVYHAAEFWLYVQAEGELASVATNGQGYGTTQDGQALTYSRRRTRWSNYTWGNAYYPD